jgi:hypothetical protein
MRSTPLAGRNNDASATASTLASTIDPTVYPVMRSSFPRCLDHFLCARLLSASPPLLLVYESFSSAFVAVLMPLLVGVTFL